MRSSRASMSSLTNAAVHPNRSEFDRLLEKAAQKEPSRTDPESGKHCQELVAAVPRGWFDRGGGLRQRRTVGWIHWHPRSDQEAGIVAVDLMMNQLTVSHTDDVSLSPTSSPPPRGRS